MVKIAAMQLQMSTSKMDPSLRIFAGGTPPWRTFLPKINGFYHFERALSGTLVEAAEFAIEDRVELLYPNSDREPG